MREEAVACWLGAVASANVAGEHVRMGRLSAGASLVWDKGGHAGHWQCMGKAHS